MQRKQPGKSASQEAPAVAMADGLADRAVRFIEDHVGQRFNVDFIARKLGVSRRTLERAFHQTFGETPHARLIRIRANAAQRALKAEPGQALTTIARTAGFSSARHLKRALGSLGLDQESVSRASRGTLRRSPQA